MTKRQQIKFYEALRKLHAQEVQTLRARIERKGRSHQAVSADRVKLQKAVVELMKLEIHIENRRAA